MFIKMKPKSVNSGHRECRSGRSLLHFLITFDIIISRIHLPLFTGRKYNGRRSGSNLLLSPSFKQKQQFCNPNEGDVKQRTQCNGRTNSHWS